MVKLGFLYAYFEQVERVKPCYKIDKKFGSPSFSICRVLNCYIYDNIQIITICDKLWEITICLLFASKIETEKIKLNNLAKHKSERKTIREKC